MQKVRGWRLIRNPAVQRVINFIREQIGSGRLSPGMMLPNRDDLARMVSVSTGTITHAIKILKLEGVLCGVRGQRPRVELADADSQLSGSDVPQPAMSPGRGYEVVAGHIRDDIANGTYRIAAAIPSCKILCARYGTSHVTLRKALDLLINQGILLRRGQRFLVPPAPQSSARPHVLFLWFSDSPFLPFFDNDISFIRLLERECFRNSLALEKCIISIYNGEILLRRHNDTAPAPSTVFRNCIGIVYLVTWWGCVRQEVFGWLAHTGKPLSIVDWLGDWKLPSSLQRKADLQLVRSSVDEKVGFEVGRFLIGLGYRRIAYFSHLAVQWPQVRLRGMQRACALARSSVKITAFMQSQVKQESDFFGLIQEKQRHFTRLAEDPPEVSPDYRAALENFSAALWILYDNATHFETLAPLLEKALSQENYDIWVGCNDAAALMAWSFLRAKGIRVPQDISLLGFGNTVEAVRLDISSYEFNHENAVGSILTFLLRPTYASRIHKLLRPRIEGAVIPRGSTARDISHR